MPSPATIAVLGSGSWATALIKIISEKDCSIRWWVRNEESVQQIKKTQRNPRYLTDVHLDLSKINAFSNIETCLQDADLVIIAIPSAFVMSSLQSIDKAVFKDKKIFSAVKGIVPEHNLIMADYLNSQLDIPYDRIGVITGPCHAEEVALEKLSYLTVACQHTGHAAEMSYLLTCRYIKTSISDDIFGTEYSAVMKNIMALASGIFHGLGYGDNFQAVLISNAIQEIKRFIDAVHPIERDIKDSAYLGDLLVTAYSQFSRNRMFGTMIGKGYSVKSAMMEMNMIAEGYYASKCIQQVNDSYKVHLPICSAVYRVLYERMSPSVEMRLLADQLS
ncbi:MAG TPA: NAD(P)H-dependent glycerol-3-phosphate dehydrogenase [Bacteroidia bacterium]|nr:NAD(P)H-dependent glycerol-3-phosphate dehydrogenase [Bacteroidia bacterium]HNT79666.1 NAD(P)H-dependent glycerol-3-phosphate dehydrogenase [Bacteroidia bacterium]